MNKLFLSIAFILIGSFINAQEVEIKDDKILLDGTPILKYEKINILQHSFYSIESDDEILLFKWHDNETSQYNEDDYIILNFLTAKVKVEKEVV